MKKLLTWCKANILFLFSLFLLAFIPLYPKLPLVDIKNVWVYVRVEDFVVLFMLMAWVVLLVRRKLTLKTPLTVPIFAFWLVGAIATIHGILLIFPTIANVFPNVALLGFFRRIEYMSLFFLAYTGMNSKKHFGIFVTVLTLTILGVLGYGIGQKYAQFPAFLTMNEEFAKGTPIQLSAMSRISSTFGGHYDLAAYLVLVIPIMFSFVFAYKRLAVKAFYLAVSVLGLYVLFLTVSRISFLALLVSFGLILLAQKKKLVLLSIPVIAILLAVFVSISPSLRDRFGNTVKQIDVIVDAQTGNPLGHVQEVPKSYFDDKVIKQQFFTSIASVSTASPTATILIDHALLPEKSVLLTEPTAPTGEDLPQGSGYINLSLSPVVKHLSNFFYEGKINPATGKADVNVINGDYLVKRAAAYDLSFTTRFQGEWPNALKAFLRNIFLGSGYGSVSLAVDNTYLRMLAEVGGLGFVAFAIIFVMIGVYMKKSWQAIDSPLVKSFTLGLAAGLVGLAINGLFIDVFEASKVAFVLWLLVGTSIALLRQYYSAPFNVYQELKKAATSPLAVVLYLAIFAVLLYSPMTSNYFVGDDFTWFRWVSQDRSVLHYFTHADGFFYRPGAKVYYLVMYSLYWLNQTVYHSVSLFLHFVVSVLVFFLGRKLFKRDGLAALAAVLFLLVTGASETVLWISATGFLFTAICMLAALLSFIRWKETKQVGYAVGAFILSLVAPLFHEVGVVTPLLFPLYSMTIGGAQTMKSIGKQRLYQLLLLPIPLYLAVRFAAQSHWFNGDYSYNLLKLPLNALGNAVGYFILTCFGPLSLPFYEKLRMLLKAHTLVAGLFVLLFAAGIFFVWRFIRRWLKGHDVPVIAFSGGLFLVTLLPFLGLGNIAPRYSYIASIGVIYLIVYGISLVYGYLTHHGRDIALAGIGLLVGMGALVHVVQLQQVTSDWYEAGETTRRFFVSIDSRYTDQWATAPTDLHFVNVPIRHGDAWVFPVGIPDALWLVFRNPRMNVYLDGSVDQALAAVGYNSATQRVFLFGDNGEVTEVKKPQPKP